MIKRVDRKSLVVGRMQRTGPAHSKGILQSTRSTSAIRKMIGIASSLYEVASAESCQNERSGFCDSRLAGDPTPHECSRLWYAPLSSRGPAPTPAENLAP